MIDNPPLLNATPYSKVRILSIDGGGIRGLIPATIIKFLEEEIYHIRKKEDETLKKEEVKIGEYFDLIAGTSTGGILACLYLMPATEPDKTGPEKNGRCRARHEASYALEVYKNLGKVIFHKNIVDTVKNFPLWNERYNTGYLDTELIKEFGNTYLNELIRPCLITAYDFFKRRAVFFNSTDARSEEGRVKNFLIRDIARATSAAPTYFEPARIQNRGMGEFNLIDGGVFVNNPAMCAYSEARGTLFNQDPFMKNQFNNDKPNNPSAKDMFILSIGTGSESKPYHYSELKNAGLVTWLPVIIDIMMSANSETVDFLLQKMFQTLPIADQVDYIRLRPSLGEASGEIDNGTEKNIKELEEAGNNFVFDNIKQLRAIAQKLVQYS